ncbi:hypothetical protein [Bowdeniella massiliensis]|uniref:phage terminase small subunit n=1 Tax=Bowdeniella massiliensis TaxID=2932264 RepID=UPI002029330F|nr:hypothetical protein [Bowdeniella massiliensis]
MVDQPVLPEDMDWPEITVEWWKALGTLPNAENFTQMQWLYLMDTALLHAAVWSGDFSRHGELGKRLEAFGVTPKAMGALTKSAAKSRPSVQEQRESRQIAENAQPANVSPLDAARERKRRRQEEVS